MTQYVLIILGLTPVSAVYGPWPNRDVLEQRGRELVGDSGIQYVVAELEPLVTVGDAIVDAIRRPRQ